MATSTFTGPFMYIIYQSIKEHEVMCSKDGFYSLLSIPSFYYYYFYYYCYIFLYYYQYNCGVECENQEFGIKDKLLIIISLILIC